MMHYNEQTTKVSTEMPYTSYIWYVHVFYMESVLWQSMHNPFKYHSTI